MANTMSKYGSNTNRPLSEIVGLSTDTKPTDSIEGIQIQNGSSFRELDTGKKFLFDAENTTWNEVSSGGGGGGGSTLIEKSISANGVYNASSDSADGYSKVTVNVTNTYTAQDEGKVVDNGALVAQTAMSSEVTENGTVDTTLYNSVTVNVPSGGGVEFSDTPTNFALLTNILDLEITVPNGVTSIGKISDTISASAFKECNGLKKIKFPSSLTVINPYAFYGSGIRNIEFSTGLIEIKDYSFGSCQSLIDIIIPDGVTTLGNYVFASDYYLRSAFLPDTVTTCGDFTFLNCSRMNNVRLPLTLTAISNSMFSGCSSLTTVTIPNGVTNIGSSAFNNCNSLASIAIPNGVTNIDSSAFRGCSSLTSIEIPTNVTTIGRYAFRDCYGLQSIKFTSTTPPTIGGTNTFQNVPTTCIIYVPTGSLSAYTSAQYYPDSSTYTYVEY